MSYLALGFIITPPFIGDSAFYTMDVLHVFSGATPPEQLWEFGHLVWRPLIYSLTPLFLSVVPDGVASTNAMKVYIGSEAISALCGIACIVLMASLLYEVCRKATGIAFTLALFILGDAFLSYSYSATPYIPALLCMILALWLPLHLKTSAARIVAATFSLGLMAALWLPFVLTVPAIAISPLSLRRGGKRWREPLLVVVALGVALLLLFGLGSRLGGCTNAADTLKWVQSSSHDWQQNRRLIRAVSGCARLLIDFGPSAVLLKRFTFKDPFNPVTIGDLAIQLLWRIVMFWTLIGSTVVACLRKPEAKPLLISFTLVAAPLVFFAIFVFEPSSPERFLPLLPSFLLLTVLLWNLEGKMAACARYVTILFVCLLPLINAPSFVKAFNTTARAAARRLQEFADQAAPGDLIVSLTLNDPISHNNPLLANYFPLVAIGNASSGRWREQFATQVLLRWLHGNNVWIQKEMLLDRPPFALMWIEGDDPKVRWADIPRFLRSLQYDRDIGEHDGFLRITHSPTNQARFTAELRTHQPMP